MFSHFVTPSYEYPGFYVIDTAYWNGWRTSYTRQDLAVVDDFGNLVEVPGPSVLQSRTYLNHANRV